MDTKIVIGIIILLVVGVVGFVFFSRQNKEDMAMIEAVTTGQPAPAPATAEPPVPQEDISGPTIEEEEKMFANDKDRDGISDSEESLLGTSDTAFDTDKDGLSDQLEINQWNTDPTNPDTDGDGYSDGIEIIEGFNPLGEGRLAQ